MYVEEEFGKIELMAWMIFVDKEHFKGVLRDYYIQCGFDLVVVKSNPTRFTCLCKDLNCAWRLHSSRLPDDKTWAIKSICPSEHTCTGLDEINLHAKVRWATSELIGDIKG